ncbi:hypothetical protein MHU86_17003 [Fragilaria crotonensis]|nr:hypothetical protein MHU86_17003 [Fragilaria crotonensis]
MTDESVTVDTDKSSDDMPMKAKKFAHELSRSFFSASSKTKEMFETSLRSVQLGVETSVTAVVGLTETPEKAPDIMIESIDEALEKLKEMVEIKKVTPQTRPQKWNFATVPLDPFQKTLDDVFVAFLLWAKVEDSNQFNVSRAFERLAAYANWMDNTGRDMIDPPLDVDSIRKAWKAWNMKVSYDKAGHFVWWLDLSDIDLERIKSIPAEENLRLFVWFSHLVMLDPHAQQNGCVLVQNLGKLQFWNSLTLLNPTLAHKIDRLTIGTMPVKMKQIYVCESPQWAQILVKLMMPFLSPIVKDRIVFLGNPKILEDILGRDCIPSGFVGTQGRLEKDIVWATFPME